MNLTQDLLKNLTGPEIKRVIDLVELLKSTVEELLLSKAPLQNDPTQLSGSPIATVVTSFGARTEDELAFMEKNLSFIARHLARVLNPHIHDWKSVEVQTEIKIASTAKDLLKTFGGGITPLATVDFSVSFKTW